MGVTVFLYVLEWIIIAGLFIVFGSQVFWPLWRGTPLFPFFRREQELLKKLSEEKQTTVEEEIKDEIAKEKKR